MKSTGIAVSVLFLSAMAANAQELRIGYLSTLTGPSVVLGRAMENGWKLGLQDNGWTKDGDKLGGVPTRIFYGDDQMKTDSAVNAVEKMIKNDKAQLIVGVIWSNVLVAISKPIFEANVGLITTNAGATPLAGELCNPLFVATAAQNDQKSESIAALMDREGIKTVFALVPNYQSGRDYLSGFERVFKGKIVDRLFFKFGESDFQAELSKVRAVKPEAVYLFAPGAMGIAFMKQWTASGLGKEIKLRTIDTVDETTLKAIGDAALGDIHTAHWSPDIPHERAAKFAKSYVAKYGDYPSVLAATNYDAVTLIVRAMTAVGGKTDDVKQITRAMRTNVMSSVRGDLKYNVNGFLKLPFYRRTVIKSPSGELQIRGADFVLEATDTSWEKCPLDKRI